MKSVKEAFKMVFAIFFAKYRIFWPPLLFNQNNKKSIENNTMCANAVNWL